MTTPIRRPAAHQQRTTAAQRPAAEAARAFVASHLAQAAELGADLGDLVDDPEPFVARLREGIGRLVDPAYRTGQQVVAPGLTDASGVRMPLLTAIRRGVVRRSRGAHPASLVLLADRLLRGDPGLEQRLLAVWILERTVGPEPERSWQLLRRAARTAGEWITVDSLAHPYAQGILAEPVRWAEIEQLAYSPSRWERRLVGSTIATIPFLDRAVGRRPEVAVRALPILANLIGDAEPDVQKALAWALRSLALVDAEAVTAFLEREATQAAAAGDGNRAWVIRDALAAVEPGRATRIRGRLAGVRRRAGAGPTSPAAAISAAFFARNPDLRSVAADQGARQQLRGQLAGGPRR